MTLAYLAHYLHRDNYVVEDWEEPNRLKYLFRGEKKWTPDEGHGLAAATWNYLGYTA